MNDVEQAVVRFYLASPDFNGIPLAQLRDSLEGADDFLSTLDESVAEGRISINFGDRHVNPHIKAFPPEDPLDQIRKLRETPSDHACVYPEPKLLMEQRLRTRYRNRPFSRRLARGQPQLETLSFDLAVLERYRNDPRYYYYCDDVSGRIVVRDSYYQSTDMPEHDQVFMQSFGFSFDRRGERYVAVCLRDLAGLSPEHQQVWNLYLRDGDIRIHPGFIAQILGQWTDGVSVFTAVLEEERQVNALCDLMGRAPLFRSVPGWDERPAELSFLIRPTSREFATFIGSLDKLLSDNLNIEFFGNDIIRTKEIKKKDGSVETRPKGSVEMLEEWTSRVVSPGGSEAISAVKDCIKAFRDVRNLRNPGAHKLNDNVFDRELNVRQKDLMQQVYSAIRTLRLLFVSHPAAKDHRIPGWLEKGQIWLQ
jgi:hypothetical protein